MELCQTMTVIPRLKLKYRCRKPVKGIKRVKGGGGSGNARGRMRVNRMASVNTTTIRSDGLTYRIITTGERK